MITRCAVLQSVTLDRPQLVARVAQLEATLATTHTTLAQVTAERDTLRRGAGRRNARVEHFLLAEGGR